ncbi:MAG: hypothetical protein QW548_01170 [Candidatus Aenigmatarchaeota archaeon]
MSEPVQAFTLRFEDRLNMYRVLDDSGLGGVMAAHVGKAYKPKAMADIMQRAYGTPVCMEPDGNGKLEVVVYPGAVFVIDSLSAYGRDALRAALEAAAARRARKATCREGPKRANAQAAL